MAREYLILDTSAYPLVIGVFQDFVPTLEEFKGWQKMMDAYHAQHDNYVLLLDFSKVTVSSIEYRLLTVKWSRENDDMFVRKNIKVVFYTPSLTTRVMMKAIQAMFRPKVKYVIVSSLQKGMTVAKQLLAENRNVAAGK
ncbi:MAG TPA: hypothetical protein VGD40_25620 [Chryseosolibacter sp.]